MADKDDYLTYYREFFENFAQTVNPNDQLPVKLACYRLVNVEVVGGIIDWTTQYLNQKKCPQNLLAPLIKIVIEETRKICKKQPVNCGFSTADNAYEPLKLMQTVMAKINEVCFRYLDNSMLCSLPSPTATPFFVVSSCAIKNSRRRMEDRHMVIQDLNTMFSIQTSAGGPSSYYAVFDGHAGHQAAAYSAVHLHQFLAESKHFVTDPEQALIEAFFKTDAMFVDKCKVENLSSGTTALVALLRHKEKTLYVAWAGDSLALLVDHGNLTQIVDPHKPSRPDERERIEKQGGCVMLWGTWRVNGQLAVSRAIGDAEYKPHVIAIPDIREISLEGSEDFLILACDGLWDFVSENCVARTVYDLVTQNPDDTDRIGQHLVQLARDQGSTDNISVVVVFLREPSKIAAEAHWANRNPSTVSTMDTTSLEDANNPLVTPNCGRNDNILAQKSDGLLLDLTDNFKHNGTDLSSSKHRQDKRPLSSEFDDLDDFGPETNIDTIDDVVLSPSVKNFDVDTVAIFKDSNPFLEHQQEKAELETQKIEQDKEEIKEEVDKFDDEERRLAREETPTPPADTVHDAGLVDNVGESDSEDEWNYIKGDSADKENLLLGLEKEIIDIDSDIMSHHHQLNPDAAEFVPVSPTRSIPSPACRNLINDEVISQSPKRPARELIDIDIPSKRDFLSEVKSRPSEVDSSFNEDEKGASRTSPTNHVASDDLLLNGKTIDEIPEFRPQISTPQKNDEFHFGPNATPLFPTPSRILDQSEAALSTRAVCDDESTRTLDDSIQDNVLENISEVVGDPMATSFFAGDTSPLDLNKVQVLPENLDEFLKQLDANGSAFNETISDLPEHNPSSDPDNNIGNNEHKQTYDDEKELASPLEPEEKEESLDIKESFPVEAELLDVQKLEVDVQKLDEVLASVDIIPPINLHSTPLLEDVLGVVESKPIADTQNAQFCDQTKIESLLDLQSTINIEPTNETKLGPEDTLLEGIQTSEKIEVDLAMEFRSEPKPTENIFEKEPETKDIKFSKDIKLSEDVNVPENIKESEDIKLEIDVKETDSIKLAEDIGESEEMKITDDIKDLDNVSENIKMLEDTQFSKDIKIPEVKEDNLLQTLDEVVEKLTEKIEVEQDFLLENKYPEIDVNIETQLPTENVDLLAQTESSAPIPEGVDQKLPEVCEYSVSENVEIPILEYKEVSSDLNVQQVEPQPLVDLAFSTSELEPILESKIVQEPEIVQQLEIVQESEIVPELEIVQEPEVVKEPVNLIVEFIQNEHIEPTAPSATTDAESVTMAEVNSSLERSLPPEVTSHLSSELTTKEEVNTEIEVRTERITAQFAEEAIVSPSEEESKHEDISAPEETKPVEEEKKVEEPVKPVAVMIPAVEAPKEPAARKSTGGAPVASKRTSVSKTSSITASVKAKSPSVKATASPKVSAVASSKVGAAPKPAAKPAGPTPRPALTPRVPNSTTAKFTIEKKKLMNGDAKPPASRTVASKKEVTAAKPATIARAPVTKTLTAPKSTLEQKATSTTTKRPITAPPKRPTSLATMKSDTVTATTTSKTTSTAAALKSTLSPRTAAAKPALKSTSTTTSSTTRPKLTFTAKPPTTKSQTPDAEKRIKDDANNKKKTTSLASARTTTARKITVENNKVTTAPPMTVTKTTTTTTTTKLLPKKPTSARQVVSKTTTKTTTTKVGKTKVENNSTIEDVSKMNLESSVINIDESIKDESLVY